MKYRFLFILLLISLFFQNLGMAQKLTIKNIVVSKPQSNKYWDAWRGSPDLKVIIYNYQNKAWKMIHTSKVYKNRYALKDTIVITLAKNISTRFKIVVYDADIRNDDIIGTQQVTLTTPNQKGNITFGKVKMFTYSFSGLKQLKQHGKAEDYLDKYSANPKQKEDFYIIYIKGTIRKLPKKEIIQVGETINSHTQLIFDKASIAAVISSTRGRLILKPFPQKEKNKSELKNLLFKPRMIAMSTRTLNVKYISDLRGHFCSVKPYPIVGETIKLAIAPKYPMSSTNFFIVQYEHDNEIIRKKLRYRGNTLILNKQEIFTVNRKILKEKERELTIFYYDGKKLKLKKIGNFTPLFIDSKKLKKEIKVMIQVLREAGKSNSEIIKEIHLFLLEFYGEVLRKNLVDWLTHTFRMKE